MKKRTFLFMMLLISLVSIQFGPKVNAQNNAAKSNFSVIGFWPMGGCRATFVVGDYAYVGVGSAMMIFDISNQSLPVHIGHTSAIADVNDIYVFNNYAYVAISTGPGPFADHRRNGLYIFDVSKPTSPQPVGFFGTGYDAHSVYVEGDVAYIATGDYSDEPGALFIIDVSIPSSPQQIGFIEAGEHANGVYVSGDYAYVVTGWSDESSKGLYIFDIKNPASPQQIWFSPTVCAANSVAVSGDKAYVVTGGNGDGWQSPGLLIFDISAPSAPQKVSSYSLPDWALDISVVGELVYIACRYNGLRIVDTSDPTMPTLIGSLEPSEFGDGFCAIQVIGNHAYVAVEGNVESGFCIIDINRPHSPKKTGFSNTGYGAENIHVAGNYAYIACDKSGLKIIDISTPHAPHEAGFVNTKGRAKDVYVSGDYAYVADDDNGLCIIDVSRPSSAKQVGHFTGGHAHNVCVYGDYAYLGITNRLPVIDISDPTSPVHITFCPGISDVNGMALYENYLCVATGASGLQIFDINTPSSPQKASSIQMQWVNDVCVSGHYAYVLSGDEHCLRVIDISNPASPVMVGDFKGQRGADYVLVCGDYAYVRYYSSFLASSGLCIFDVSDPVSPELIEWLDDEIFYGASSITGLYAKDNIIYLTSFMGGFFILQNNYISGAAINQEQKPKTFDLIQNYPNPFNPTTAIAYDLPTAGHVRLVIYDVLGRHIRTLVDRREPAGRLQTSWDGTNEHDLPVAGGLYFCRMQAGEFSRVIKMVLVR